jgi:group I intron endonuclease
MTANNYLIYKHTSPSGKSYIGQTKDYEKRCAAHKRLSSGCRIFSHAIQHYGWDTFSHEILHDNLTIDQANELEALCILQHNTLSPNGYNLRTGGDNETVSDDTRNKQREAQLGMKHSAERNAKKSKYLTGRKHSPERINKVTIANTGKKRTAEQIERIAATKRGVKQSAEHIELRASKIRGVKKSPEHIEKVSLANIGKVVSEETRKRQREAQLGKTRSQEAIDKIATALRGRTRPKEIVDSIAYSRNKNIFEKELTLYNINIKHLTDNEMGTTVLTRLLNVDRSVINARIKANKFPNAYFKHPAWHIQLQDIHDYYINGSILYGL